jgi:hypothetical protein
MPVELTEDQVQDLRDIHLICRQMKVEFVIVGAIAYKLYFKDVDRFTADIDAVIALDLDEFAEFITRLERSGWKSEPNQGTPLAQQSRILLRYSAGRPSAA